MADKQPAVLSFHQVREQCEQGATAAWRAFLERYTPPCGQLLKIYAPGAASIWERTLDVLARDKFQLLSGMDRQSEREFLMELRAQLFECARTEAEKGQDAGAPAATLDLERAAKIVEGLPLLHQEILWFHLAGYTDATIERILRMSPRVAQAALDRLNPDFAAAREPAEDRSLWPRQWLALLHQARAAKKEECPPLHQLLRIHDGQVSWYDKEPVEKKVAGCLHCLDAWTGLREVAYWRRAAPAVSAEQVEGLLQRLPVAAEPKKKKTFLGGIFSKG